MKISMRLLAASTVLIATLACTIMPRIPDLGIDVPTIEVGEVREERHAVPLPGAESARVDITFGAGRLQLEAGASGELMSGSFLYNVDRWAPEIALEGDILTIRQGGDEAKWGIPSGNVRNRWELAFSRQMPLSVHLRAGAGEGDLDFTDLRVTDLDIEIGAGDFVLRFDRPSPAPMDHITLDTGASRIEILGVGNASPETMRVRGGVGDISVDLTGEWARSADISVRAGAGALTLRLPDGVGVEVETRGGLANVEAYGLRQMGGTYTNDAYGETEIELHVDIIAGVGNIRLIDDSVRE